jgi:hypothetical protein
MDNADDTDSEKELLAMQQSIYREKVLRARQMSPEERLADVFALSNSAMARMHEGAMWQHGLTDEDEGWTIVSQRLERLRQLHEKGLFVNERDRTCV